MKIAILGRTRWLIDTADACAAAGHSIVAVATARSESFYKCGSDDFSLLAARTGAKYLGEVSLSRPEVQAQLAATGADIALSINWPTIVGAEVINLFPHGIVNAHCGDLPRYRGNACPNWAILNGDSHIGLCAHRMAPDAVDAGPILLKDYLPVSATTYIGDVYDWLDGRIPTLLAAAIDGLAKGIVTPTPQPTEPALALRCYPRRAEDARIDWRLSVDFVHRLVRASSRPFDGAFTCLEDGRLARVWRASPFAHPQPFCAVPGQVMLRADDDPVIACGEGALRLEEVEIAGMQPDDAKKLIGKSLRTRLVWQAAGSSQALDMGLR
ncbi:MAG: formyltransferase family protein [Polaromonas sp.]